MKRLCAAAMVAGALVWGTGAHAFAHVSLTTCSIKNGQVFRTGHSPRTVKATFAEDLDPKQSWAKVFEGRADHGIVEKQAFKVNLRNPKEIIVTLPPLGKEKYYLIWYTRSADDNHVAAGIVYFQVK